MQDQLTIISRARSRADLQETVRGDQARDGGAQLLAPMHPPSIAWRCHWPCWSSGQFPWGMGYAVLSDDQSSSPAQIFASVKRGKAGGLVGAPEIPLGRQALCMESAALTQSGACGWLGFPGAGHQLKCHQTLALSMELVGPPRAAAAQAEHRPCGTRPPLLTQRGQHCAQPQQLVTNAPE